MKHLDICRKYFETFGLEMIETSFPQLIGRYAAGLAGEGSGCFGYDDEISRDHDFAPGFCIWLTDEDYDRWGSIIQTQYDSLPSEFMGIDKKNTIAHDRMGVMKISSFYASFTGCSDIPSSTLDWFLISEQSLAAATNGEVFTDGLGKFTRIRNALLDFYPDDVLLKKLAARCAIISQSGQYNMTRCMKRGDMVAAGMALSKFAEAAISMIHLLNRKAMPFYKWSFRSLTEIDIKAASLIETAVGSGPEKAQPYIEELCAYISDMLRSRGLVTTSGNFLQDHIPQLMGAIKDEQLSQLHPMADCP